MREAVRLVQEGRKAAGLEVTDRIDLWWEATGTDLAEALRAHTAEVAAEVLATTVAEGRPEGLTAARDEELGLTYYLRKA